MKRVSSVVMVWALVVFGTMWLAGPARADSVLDDRAALAGLKEVKAAFDLTNGDAKALLNQLNVIAETRASLVKQGVTPHFLLAFRGPATRLVQTDVQKIKPEERETAAKIAAKIKELGAVSGVSLQQCSIAASQQDVKKEHMLPEIAVIGNSWISLMAYQAKGYAYIHP